jgi:divalent metal cation (Fe/Co/Zn/Cd) transporter
MAELRQRAVPQPNVSLRAAIIRIQWFTIAWMTIETGISLFTATRAHSIALAAFGADSAIELLSAATVLWSFGSGVHRAEAPATKITAWLLIALAVYIAGSSFYVLIWRRKAEPSYLGIALLIAAAIIMPWLGNQKRRLAATSNSTALSADATQSAVCAYLAWIALAGLLLNALVQIWWADAFAALCLIPFIIKEAKEAFEGRPCECG